MHLLSLERKNLEPLRGILSNWGESHSLTSQLLIQRTSEYLGGVLRIMRF